MSRNRNLPRSPSALNKPLAGAEDGQAEPGAAPAPALPPAKSADDAVAQCLEILQNNKVTLKDGKPVSQAMLPTVVLDILGLLFRSQAEAQQLRATLKTVL